MGVDIFVMKYWQRKKQERLYRQWAKYSELPPEAIPPLEEPEAAGQPEYVRPARELGAEQDAGLEVGHNARYIVEDRGLWYRFRLLLVDLVRKILRVD